MQRGAFQWVLRGIAELLAAGLLLGAAAVASAATLELREARSMVTINGTTSTGTSTLPYHWDRLHRAQAGQAQFETVFTLPTEPAEPQALYFSRLGNAFEVWLNGSLLARSGDINTAGGSDAAKAPRYFSVPPQLLQRENLLRIVIRVDGGRRGGVAAPVFGPEPEVRALFEPAFRWRLAGSLVVSIFSLLSGTIALVLWFTQPRVQLLGAAPVRDPIYLFAGLAELGWALRMGDAVIEAPPLAWPWWGIVVASAYAGWIVGMTLFCHHVAGSSSRMANRILGTVFVTGVAAASWALLRASPTVWTIWLGIVAVGFVAYGLYYSVLALRKPEPARVLVAVAVMANVLAGLRDWLAVRLSGDFYGEGSWVRYTSVLFGVTLLYIVVSRFRAASTQAQDLMTTLSDRVAKREAELAQSYQRLEVLAREQAGAAERTRILRDMHDGVGSHISTAIRQLQSGRASNADVLLTLRDSLDQLKLSIDSMNLPPGDVTALLASMRYRLEPRFAASDIALVWDVALLPLLPRLDAHALRQLQYLVFEALSNVLQHARAHTLTLSAHEVQGVQTVCVQDDGCGFDAQAVRNRGIASMRERASAIGAQLHIRSAPGGTVVEIALPSTVIPPSS